MAKISGLKEKQLALKEINAKLKALVPLNEFLDANNEKGLYSISFGNVKTTLLCQDKETINLLVRAYKKTIVDEIKKQAEEYSIEFDEEDKKLLG